MLLAMQFCMNVSSEAKRDCCAYCPIIAARWGRFQESVSECPWLNGAYAVAFVEGMQGDDAEYTQIAACCKHLIGYSFEGTSHSNVTRHNFDAVIDDHDLSETYAPAFRRCVQEARPLQIMCSCESRDYIGAAYRRC